MLSKQLSMLICNGDSYLLLTCMKLQKYLTAFFFCCDCARVLISFPLDQKYTIIIVNDKKFQNRPIITTMVPKHFVLETPCRLVILLEIW